MTASEKFEADLLRLQARQRSTETKLAELNATIAAMNQAHERYRNSVRRSFEATLERLQIGDYERCGEFVKGVLSIVDNALLN